MVLAAAGRVHRLAEAAMAAAVTWVSAHDDAVPHPERTTTRYGARNLNELIQRATRMPSTRAAMLIAASRATAHRSGLTGEVLPAQFPCLRDVFAAGGVGVDGVAAVTGPLRRIPAGRAEVLAADEELAAAACGEGAGGAAAATADELRALAHVWAAVLDPDGTEPDDSTAMRRRDLTLGPADENGGRRIRGYLVAEVAAQLELATFAVLNPKGDGAPAPGGPRFDDSERHRHEPVEAAADQRTPGQQRHDAFAVLLNAAVASAALPTLGGAAPTLVIMASEEDLVTGTGCGHLPGSDHPVSLAAASDTGCCGVIERVRLDKKGRIVSIHTLDRVFTHHQRKAITLRDGGCLIPGCHAPPQWCEIHHVIDHAKGGPTHTDNGVLLCWFHHRTIDTSEWTVRMIDGVPYIKGPHWWDATRTWRPATKSPTRRRDQITARIAAGG